MFERVARRDHIAPEDRLGYVMRWVLWFDDLEQNAEHHLRQSGTDHLTSFPTDTVVLWFVMTNTEGTTTAFECVLKSRKPRSYEKWGDYIAADFDAIKQDAERILLTELRPYHKWRRYALIGWTGNLQIQNPYSAKEAFCCTGYSRDKRGFTGNQENVEPLL